MMQITSLSRSSLAALLTALSMVGATAGSCKLKPLPIHAAAPDRKDLFIGRSSLVELQFKNDKTEGEIDTFPERPLVVRQVTSGKTCEVDGGVWVRKSVFISTADRVIVTHEFSGANDSLNFYDAFTCEKLQEIDTSKATWTVNGALITVFKPGTASDAKRQSPRGSTTRYRLDSSCQAVKSFK